MTVEQLLYEGDFSKFIGLNVSWRWWRRLELPQGAQRSPDNPTVKRNLAKFMLKCDGEVFTKAFATITKYHDEDERYIGVAIAGHEELLPVLR